MTNSSPRSVLVCLHGWGGSKESFTELRAALQGSDIEVLTPDLPGFGSEPEPNTPWTNDDYANWTASWIEKNVSILNSQFSILGHSHGGRIAMKLAIRQTPKPPNLQTIKHLFLCAPAGIRHGRHFKRMFGLTLAKTGKFFLSIPGLRALAPLAKKLLYKLVRVHDYEKASDVMRQTMINVTKEDFRPLLKDVNTKTDLFWGTDDGMTPYSDALLMEKSLPNVTLHTYPGIHHRVHRDKAQEIATIIRQTLA